MCTSFLEALVEPSQPNYNHYDVDETKIADHRNHIDVDLLIGLQEFDINTALSSVFFINDESSDQRVQPGFGRGTRPEEKCVDSAEVAIWVDDD